MKYQIEENCLTIFLPKELDHHQTEEIRREADRQIERNHVKYVIFDFGETSLGGESERTDEEDPENVGSGKDYSDLRGGKKMKQDTNEMELIFDSCSENEGFARVAVAAFLTQLNPTLEEVADVKTAVSEAVTNAVIHGYDQEIHKIRIRCRISGHAMEIEIRDEGNGIEDVEKAMQPMFTTRPELDRSGMGFAFMEAFMDELEVESEPGKGTTVRMKKKIGSGRDGWIVPQS